ncbi:MAG: hypothetical protein KIC51_05700 [Acetobacter sp.]|nr:hypothetical protein [Acetobacter sp.]
MICRRSGGSATGNEGSTGNDGGTGHDGGNGAWLWAMAAATYRGVTGEWRQLRTAAGALRFYGTILLSISLK